MAPLSRGEGSDVSQGSPLESTWTAIPNRSKTFNSDNQKLPIGGEAASRPVSQPKEMPGLQPERAWVPTTIGSPTSHGQTSPSHRCRTSLDSPTRQYAESKSELIGHPEVLLKDFCKKRKREMFLTSDEEEGSGSESDPDSPDTESDSTGYSGCRGDYDDESDAEEATKDNNDQYPFLRKDIVEFIYTLFVLWMTSVRYIIPPEHRLKLSKKRRAKRAKMFMEETDPKDPGVILISAIDGYYHLACPFYRTRPNRHQDCIRRHSIRSIEDLVVHIVHHHNNPPLCKICGKIFDNYKECNEHVRNGTCEAPDPDNEDFKIPRGVTQFQQTKILKQDNPQRTEEARWTRIYKTIFESEPTVSPYLTEGEGFKFSLLHDYWKSQGKECVRRYLRDHGHARDGSGHGGSTEFAKLCSLVLEDLRKKVQEEQADGERK